jgi:hypothetical protein
LATTGRSATCGLLSSLFLLGFALPNSSWAVPYARFDKMGIEAQAEFVTVMVEVTKTVVRREGKSDQWIKIDNLFTTVLEGAEFSVGVAEYERNEARERVFDLERAAEDPKARRLDVEDAWFVTLKKNGIELSQPAMTAVLDTMKSFHPLTYNEYLAKTVQQRMPIVKAFAEIGFLDYCLRRKVRDKEKTILNLNERELRDFHTVMDNEFPRGVPDVDGFWGLNKQIEATSKEAPDTPGPMFELILYVLKEIDAIILKRINEMDANAVLMPDGRHVFPDHSGNLWSFAGEKSYQLEGADKALAQKLLDCKNARHIENGAESLEVCREQVGLGKSGRR